MSIWIVIALAWFAAMLLLVVALTRMAARGDMRRDRHGSFSVDQLRERTARHAVRLEIPEIFEDEPESTDVHSKPEVLGRAPESTDAPGEPEIGSSR